MSLLTWKREWGSLVAQSFLKRTNDIIELLSEYPYLGTKENPKKSIRGFLLTKHNRLFYIVADDQIILLNFFDTRSGPKRAKY